ncbi:MAG TPA: hypothetical protein DIW17_06005 [Clostridiales bacterium]|nr:hypothetical protein [Clostridiales bacterium]
MIKIDTKGFNWLDIYDIYRDDDKVLINPLVNKIKSQYEDDGTHQIVKNLLTWWFFEDGNISVSKVSGYLIDENLVEKIMQYDEAISSVMPQADRCFSAIISSWPVAKREALMRTSPSERKEIIAAVIKPQNIHMFDGISENDLIIKPKYGTVYSSKDKMKQIKLLYEDEISTIISQLSEVFNYNTYSHKLLTAMHIEVCPYCNRQYITGFSTNGISRSTADIDHFYSKTQYPFLALSLYNFIPSCQICNSRFKLTADFGHSKHINPYKCGFDKDGVFKFKSIESLLGGPLEYEIENLHNREDISNSINTFHLNEVYQTHQDYVEELVKKAQIYNESQFAEYLENFGELFKNKGEMQRIIFGNYVQENELGKRPLAKLTKDLLNDLGVKIED